MRSRCMSLLPRTTLHSDSEQVSYFKVAFSKSIFKSPRTTILKDLEAIRASTESTELMLETLK